MRRRQRPQDPARREHATPQEFQDVIVRRCAEVGTGAPRSEVEEALNAALWRMMGGTDEERQEAKRTREAHLDGLFGGRVR